MAITITINGVNQTTKCRDAVLEGGRQLNYNRVAGSPATLTLFTYDRTGGGGGYRPAIDHTVVVADGATTLFSGVITDIREQALSDASAGWDKGILSSLTCADQNGLLLRDSYTKEYADGTTLKQVLQDLIANPLSTRSITLDGAQANGPALTGFKFVDAYIDDILNSLTTITGYVWDITPGKVLSMVAPGTVSCGFSLTDGGGSIYGGVTIEQGRSENYANRVTVVAGPAAQLLVTETIVGNGVLDHWTLTYTPVTNAAGFIVSAGYVTDDGVFSPLSQYSGGGTNWQWEPATNQLHRTAGALPNTKVATLVYSAQFPISVTVNDAGEQAAHGIYARRFITEDVLDRPTAVQLATGLLSRSIASPQIVHVAHRKGLAKPGQSVVLTFSERNINSTYMITEVSFWNEVDGSITYALGCVSGSTQPDSWVEYFKRGGSGSGASASAAPISGAIIPTISGIFEGDLIANSGLDNASNKCESALTNFVNSAGVGAALRLGRNDKNYTWAIVADADHGATAGAVGKLRFQPVRRGSSIEAAMMLAEPDSGGTDDFMLLPGANANLYLGDYAALMSGLSPSDSRIEGILAANIMATSGYFERSRTTRMGEWVYPAFSAGNFTSDVGSWGVDSGDVITYGYTIQGKTITVSFEIQTTDITGTPGYLKIAIPGGFTAAKNMRNTIVTSNSGGTFQSGVAFVGAAEAFIRIYKNTAAAAWAATAADDAYVLGQITFEVA
jgi:hypothetical protein